MELSIISWNIRGLGKKEKCCAVRKLITSRKPKILLIQETKLAAFTLATFRSMGVRQNLGRVFSPAEGSAGGLISIWDTNFLR
ncbi:hypothetical protein HRI_002261500 [Hibiscus trionum]|uniref:Endonuclease/exonuclease/phosphatase domain-containing protein n=1 Tax=Hibiscus trionum TaxID=183268 RepID=A0A9W7M1E6_HIBTR|nr:hypothetical protein HRI_002261500 [Hibiscus trionum]